MKPYYADNLVTLFHGDCRELLPSLQGIDLVLTDPPYGVDKKYASYKDGKSALQNLLSDVLPMLSSAADKRLITCGIGNIWEYPRADWVLCWSKPNGMTRSAVANANIWEPILVYGCKGFGVDGVTVSISPQLNGHPCPKPLRLFTWLIVRASLEGETILDPFTGSGTTLQAAKELGRRAIGIEIEEKYCEIAARRLEVTQPALFTAPTKERQEQASCFQ